MDVSGGNIVEQEDEGEVINDVGERTEERALEAMGRDGFLDFTESERWFRVGDPVDGVLVIPVLVFGFRRRRSPTGTHCCSSKCDLKEDPDALLAPLLHPLLREALSLSLSLLSKKKQYLTVLYSSAAPSVKPDLRQ